MPMSSLLRKLMLKPETALKHKMLTFTFFYLILRQATENKCQLQIEGG